MTDPKKNKPAELTEGQLNDVAGGVSNPLNDIDYIQPVLQPGEEPVILVQPMGFKYCAADPTHVYPVVFDACPVCGCKEYTDQR